MVTADIWPALPENPSWIFVVALGIVVGYLLLRAYTANQQIQINGLREALDRQEERHDRQIRELNEKIESLTETTEEARAERHRLRGEVANKRLALSIVAELYTKCSCGALDPVSAVLHAAAQEEGAQQ